MENKRRDREQVDHSYDDVYIDMMGKEGQVEKVKVDKVNYLCVQHDAMHGLPCAICYQEFLDLTDIQNRDFRYVL